MVWAKTEHYGDLKERIKKMLKALTDLMEFGTLSKEFIALTAETVQWVKTINPVFEINSTMYEALKFEYEEKLQRTIKLVNHSTDKLIPLLAIFNDMDDFLR